jgi:hypothetical protein
MFWAPVQIIVDQNIMMRAIDDLDESLSFYSLLGLQGVPKSGPDECDAISINSVLNNVSLFKLLNATSFSYRLKQNGSSSGEIVCPISP